jgi:hypothetical protein
MKRTDAARFGCRNIVAEISATDPEPIHRLNRSQSRSIFSVAERGAESSWD